MFGINYLTVQIGTSKTVPFHSLLSVPGLVGQIVKDGSQAVSALFLQNFPPSNEIK